MKMRMPSVPLITVDPYFSVWSQSEIPNQKNPVHWTGSRNAIRGTVNVDGAPWSFLGKPAENAMTQVSLDADATTATAVFEGGGIRLTAKFTTPVLVEELYYVSRPVSYLKLSAENMDGETHTVTAKISCSEELVLNKAGEGRACSREEKLEGVSCVRMGSGAQKVLWRSGDDVRIDWGYFYLAVRGEATVGNEVFDDLYAVSAETALTGEALFLFAYDNIDSICYFHKPLKAYWKKEGQLVMRPVMRYARTEEWQFDFAPHDVGQYPLVNGQVYGDNALQYQMPVEECGNIMILVAAMCAKDGDYTFAAENMELLEKWNRYLVQYGADPENQLCTDDFAGHLAYNCNLSLKAIMGVVGFANILTHLDRGEEAAPLMEKAREYIAFVLKNAKNDDGSYRLAYDRPGTFSLKYNAILDKLWKTHLIPEEFFKAEIERYKKEALPYGVPLDSREKYTKSDWLLWVACFSENRENFEFFADLLWKAYDTMRTRVPMTDWYFADTSEMRGFQHRAVLGGLFMKLLF